MPIYEYICTKCKQDFEILQKITDKPKSECPECAGKLEKVISQSAFHLKGSGWFKPTTDDTKKDSKKSSPVTPSKAEDKGAETSKKSCSSG